MLSAFVLSSIFLISYVISKLSNPPVPFGGEGMMRNAYFCFNITYHTSIPVLPLALLAIYRGMTGEFDKHMKIVKDISYLDVCSRNGSVSIYIYDSLLPINMKNLLRIYILLILCY